MTRWYLSLLILVLLMGPCYAEPNTAGDAVVQAELKMLRATVARQAKEIESLRAELAALRKHGLSEPVHVAPVAVARKVKNVLFVVDGHSGFAHLRTARGDIDRALEQFQSGQAFNIFVHGSRGVTALQRGFFIEATPENRRRAEQFLNFMPLGAGCLEDALHYAINQRPDLICLLSVGKTKDVAAALRAVKEHNAGPRIPINTTLKYAIHSPAADKHFLWQLAKDNGGRCTNADGEDADEPVVPNVVAPAPKPTPVQTPDLFRLN